MDWKNTGGCEEAENLPHDIPENTDLATSLENKTEDLESQTETKECETVSLEREKEKFVVKNVEHLLNSFSDMLQTEIHAVVESLWAKISENTYKTNLSMDSINSEMKDKFIKVLETQEVTIQKQHQTITKFQEDLLYKLQKPLIMEIIGIADNIRMILQEQEEENNYGSLIEAVKNLEQWVDATLSNNSVRSFRDTENSVTELNRKRQEVIDTEETDNPEKNNTYISERPGYIWTMPYLIINSDVQLEKIVKENTPSQMFAYVIRPEEVIKLKCRKDK